MERIGKVPITVDVNMTRESRGTRLSPPSLTEKMITTFVIMQSKRTWRRKWL